MRNFSSTTLLRPLAAAAILAMGASAFAVPVVYSGTDASNGFANSEAAFADWANAVGSHTLDNLDVLNGTGGFGGSLTSNLGNTFTVADDDLISINTFGFPVMDGTNLRMTGNGSELSFNWNLAMSADAFGFFSRDNDGGLITITFNDGSTQVYSLSAAPTGNDNLFWGIDGLDGSVMSVAITSTDMDPGSNNSFWDRFVYRETVTAVAEPGVLSLLGIALLSLGIARRRHGI